MDMRKLRPYAIGFIAFFPIALVAIWAGFAALDREAENRATAQNKQNAALMRKMPAIYKARNIADCVVEAGELRCESSIKGVRVTRVYQ